MTILTASEINALYRADYEALLAQYGSEGNIPKDERYMIGEMARGRFVLLGCAGDVKPSVALRHHAVAQRVMDELVGDDAAPERKSKMVDKYSAVETWVKENPNRATTVYEVAEVGELSYSAALAYVKDHLDFFRKEKKGQYWIRDVVAERTAANRKV